MKKILLLILLLAVAAVGFLFFTEQGLAVRTMVERQAPIVTPATVPQAVGRSGHTFKFKVNDGRSGVAQVRAVGRAFKTPGEILHGDLELLVQSFEPPVIGEKEIEVVVPAGSELLRTDGAQIQVELTVTDRSLFANSASESATALIDLITPRVEVLTGQHNVAQGGIGLAFYKVNKRPPLLIRHGVVVAGIEHPGVPASVWDKSFESQPDLYAALFYLPYSEQMEALNRPELDAIPRAFAVDHANNRVQVDLPHYVIGKSQPAETLKLNRKFLENKIPPLAESYNQETGTVLPNEADVTDQLVSLFLLVNQGYRGWLGQKIKGMLVQPTPEILWQGLFQRPMAAKPTARFMERRSYDFEGRDLGKAIHEGVDLASVKNDQVFAANRGRVIFADFLGIYGNAVILDHGVGLSTLYGHLASTDVNLGQVVEKGQFIGRSGETGLAGGDHLHYEIRLNGVPTSPFEWWDEKWIHDRIQVNIDGVKAQFAPKPEETAAAVESAAEPGQQN